MNASKCLLKVPISLSQTDDVYAEMADLLLCATPDRNLNIARIAKLPYLMSEL